MLNYNFDSKSRLRVVPIYLRDSRASETRACVKITSREKGETRWGAFLAWGDFHASSRFPRSTKAEEKWGLLVAICTMTSFTTATRILQGFPFLCKLRLLSVKSRWDYKFKYEKKNEKNSGRRSKMTPSSKWPIPAFK